MLNVISGILGTGGGVVGSYESIATYNLTSTQTGITFSSIPQTYKHLQLRMLSLTTSTGNQAYMQFNGTTTPYWSQHNLSGNGSTATAGNNSTYPASSAIFEAISVGHSPTYPFVAIVDILDYTNTNKYKVIRSLAGTDQNTTGEVNFFSASWNNTAAINSIYISTGLTYAVNSHFALYGIKG